MSTVTSRNVPGYERVVSYKDPASGLHAIIAIHDTTLGPALGGCRMFPYADEEQALQDVLRLSRGMTYKSTMAELPFGSGKSVIIGDPRKHKSEELLKAFGQDSLEGLTVAVQGVGNVGGYLADTLSLAGARLIVTDINNSVAHEVAARTFARVVAPDEIFNVGADVFAPCAMGAVLNDNTIPRLTAGIVLSFS